MWDPSNPDNFSGFTPSDMPAFLEWWEMQHSNALSLQISGAFVEGISEPYLTLIAQGQPLPSWVETMLRWRLASQWVYQQGYPLMQRLERGLPGLLGVSMPAQFRLTPAELAEIPPQLQQAFLEGNTFSNQWIRRLSNDARELISDLMAANQLKNQNPRNAVPILEQVLRRDLIAQELGLDPDQVTPDMIQEWIEQAEFSVLEQLARRADLIAVTEGARMQNLGILTAFELNGDKLAYVMPHAGSCEECQRLIDGRVFLISTLKENLFANFGVKKQNWKPALPQHPRCRHSPMEIPWRFRDALSIYGDPPATGVLLEYYGLPGGEAAMNDLALPPRPWLTRSGEFVSPGN